MARCKRCGTERSSGSAARAALDLKGAPHIKTSPVAAAARLRSPCAWLEISSGHKGQRSLAAAATGLRWGSEAHVDDFMALLRSSAARAALPELRSVPHLLQRAMA